jgi:hypothetical protein
MDSMRSLEHHPNGYPDLGLQAKTLRLVYRHDANLYTLARRVERWEAAHGNAGFEARNLHKLPVALAFELCNVYIALRERYPQVKPDFVNFSTDCGAGKTLGMATIYPSLFPTLRQAAEMYEADDASALAAVVVDDDEFWFDTQDIQNESVYTDGVRDVQKSGVIELGNMFTTKKHYLALRTYWERRNERAALAGRPLRTPPLATSEATFVLVHEFGHLVEGELFDEGWAGGLEAVYRVLSEILLGVDNPSPTQWRQHLINYPAYTAPHDASGPQQGGVARQQATRRALRAQIAEKLGTYAPTARDEIFAEAFSLSQCAAAGRRRELSGLLRVLEQYGMRRNRVRRTY